MAAPTLTRDDVIDVGDVRNDVLYGHDGELFLASGGHHVLDYVRGERTVDDATLGIFARNIRERFAYATSRGAGYLHLICPDKQSVLHDRLPIQDPIRMAPLFIAAASESIETILYPIEQLRSAQIPAYLKTDTHLSDFGIIQVAMCTAEALTGLNLEAARHFLETVKVFKERYVGDLGRKLVPEMGHEETFVRVNWPHHYFHNRIDGGNNGAVDIIISPDAGLKKRLLLMGDSFGRQVSKFLSYIFQEILFLRTPFFHPDIFDQYRPDYLVTENIERYLPSCESDDDRPCFHLFPYLKGRTTEFDQSFSQAFSALLSFPRPPYHAFITPLISGKPAAAMEPSADTPPDTAIAASETTIAIPPDCVASASAYAVRPEIHPADFIYKFVKLRWPAEPEKSINQYYDLGKYSADLLADLLKEVSRVKAFLGESWAPENILDFASGYGCCSRHLTRVFPDSTISTCDIHEDAVSFNATTLGLRSYLSDPVPENIDLPKHDVVVAMSFFSHMPQSTYARWLRALFETVKPGGVFIFTANGHVTEKKGTAPVRADENGFGFEQKSEQQDLDTAQYGITISHPRWVLAALQAIPGLRVARFQEGLWWAIQDTYVSIRDNAG